MKLSTLRQILGRPAFAQRSKKGLARKSNRTARLGLHLERLEDRSLMVATVFVDDSWIGTAPGSDPDGAGPATQFGTDSFATIQGGVDNVDNGGTVDVNAGDYPELVTVNKDISVLGAQAGVDARTRSGIPSGESVVRGALNGANRTTSFNITASGVTVDGFTVRDQTDNNQFNAGIVMNAATSGVTVRNNIVTNNVIGIFAGSSGASLIERNLIDGNNSPGPSGGAGLYSESTSGLTVDNNEFRNQTQNNPLLFAATADVAHVNLTVSNNSIHDNVSGIFALGINGGVFQGNSISTGGTATALTFGGSDKAIDVLRNDLSGNLKGLRIADFGFLGVKPNSDIEAHYNSFANDSTYGAGISDEGSGLTDGYTGTLDLSNNWWGSVTGPTTAANPGGTGTVLRNDYADTIIFKPWLLYDDASASAVGFQTPTPFTVTAQTANFTATNNNYTRLLNAIAPLQDGQTLILNGTFDWTEPNAAAAWALGNDGIANTADDYSIVVPENVNGVTITASSLGSARVQGPGDLAAANLEGVLVFDGGDNQNWTLSNLEIFDFDLAIGMFNGAGGTDAYSGTKILNNHIRVPADLNATVAPTDVNQNIGINFSFGKNQTIQGNLLDIAGDGVSDGANLSSTVGMQSNTSGGDAYDGLLIDNNTLNITSAQSANPARIIGIWENAHGHSSNITVSNNDFVNLAAGNNSTLNLERAFRVTSHSSATTTVTYAGNTVSGANIGFEWLAGSDFSGNQPVHLSTNTVTGANVGVLVQSNGLANLFQNTITGSATAGVQVLSGSLAAVVVGGNAVQENFISGGAGAGIVLALGSTVTGGIFNNDLSANVGLAVDNQTVGIVNASGNWWGTSTAAGVAGEVNANVDYTPWLDVGTDIAPATPGFQGSFATLHVDDSSVQSGALGRIAEGILLATGATPTVIIEAGTYAENVAANKAGLVLKGATGLASDVVIDPAGVTDGITVTANNVTIRDLRVTGAANAIVASSVSPLSLLNLQLDGNTSGGVVTNVSTLNFTASPGIDTIAATDAVLSSTGVQAISLSGITNMNIFGGSGSDIINVVPSSTMTFNIDGDLPTPPATPGDALNVDLSGTTSAALSSVNTANGRQGTYTFGNRMPIHFQEIETLGSPLGSSTLTPGTAVLIPDPTSPGQNTLQVVGTAGNDHIIIDLVSGGTQIRVRILMPGPDVNVRFNTASINKIVVFALDGNDIISMSSRIFISTELNGDGGNDRIQAGSGDDLVRGGTGNDTLLGGKGDDILLGEAGNDRLYGQNGLDILIGGVGRDVLQGNRGENVLIGGTTAYDDNDTALRSLMSEWHRTAGNFQERTDRLSAFLNPPVNVKDDGEVDTLISSPSFSDWFLDFALADNHRYVRGSDRLN